MDNMAKKREAILNLSLKRQVEMEQKRAQREEELAKQKDEAAAKKEEQERKKFEYKQRREAILEQYRLKKTLTGTQERNGHATGGCSCCPPCKGSCDDDHGGGGGRHTQMNNTMKTMMKQSQSSWSIYTGPKLFAKPTTKTNLITIQNAIVKALEGAANEKSLKRMQETISLHQATCSHFLILFRNRHQFRGLYQYEQKPVDTIKKLDGIGPRLVNKEDIVKYYKFDTPKRLFVEVQTRDISLTIIAFSLKDHLWAKTKPPPPTSLTSSNSSSSTTQE